MLCWIIVLSPKEISASHKLRNEVCLFNSGKITTLRCELCEEVEEVAIIWIFSVEALLHFFRWSYILTKVIRDCKSWCKVIILLLFLNAHLSITLTWVKHAQIMKGEPTVVWHKHTGLLSVSKSTGLLIMSMHRVPKSAAMSIKITGTDSLSSTQENFHRQQLIVATT